MKILTIRRFVPENIDATYGVYLDGRVPFAATLELPWRNNAIDISCIPTGEYMCKLYSSDKYPNVWQVMNVVNRSLILQHWGNYLKNSNGCILVGEKFCDLNQDGIADIGESRTSPNEGFNELMLRTKGLEEYKLVIEESYEWLI